jgi:predicted nucleotidyltransferase
MTDRTGSASLVIAESVRRRLDELKEALVAALGDDLVSLIVHGSAVRGGWREGTSDVDIVVVLRNDARTTLEKMANPLLVARYSARIEAMILTATEIARAADVFPVFYEDIRRQHVVLFGDDPFASLEITDHHLRLRVEQELREAQIRMRRVVVDGNAAQAVFSGQIVRKVRQIRAPLLSLMGLKGVPCKDDLESVLKTAAKTYGLSEEPLFEVQKDPQGAHATLTVLLQAAIDDADKMEKAT